MKANLIIVGLLGVILAGCDHKEPSVIVHDVNILPSQVMDRIAILESNAVSQSNLTAISSQIFESQDQQHFILLSNWCYKIGSAVDDLHSSINQKDVNKSIASIDPEQKGYSKIETEYGILFVRTDSVEPYLDGYKIYLQIGNPNAASFVGFNLKVAWPSEKQGEGYTVRTNEFTTTLRSGSWNKIDFVIAPATAAQIRGSGLMVNLDEVSLNSSTP